MNAIRHEDNEIWMQWIAEYEGFDEVRKGGWDHVGYSLRCHLMAAKLAEFECRVIWVESMSRWGTSGEVGCAIWYWSHVSSMAATPALYECNEMRIQSNVITENVLMASAYECKESPYESSECFDDVQTTSGCGLALMPCTHYLDEVCHRWHLPTNTNQRISRWRANDMLMRLGMQTISWWGVSSRTCLIEACHRWHADTILMRRLMEYTRIHANSNI